MRLVFALSLFLFSSALHAEGSFLGGGGGGGSGTVTSVDVTTPSWLTVTGTPITTSGTAAIAAATGQTAHRFIGTGAGSSFGVTAISGADLPNPAASTLGGVNSKAAVSNNFLTSIGTDGSVTQAQPSFSNLSGTATGSQLPNPSASTLGGVQSKAAVSNNFLTSIGTDGSVTQAQPSFSNLSGTATGSQLPNPSSSTLGGVQSKAAVTSNFLTSISTSGVPAAAQPAFSDLSGNIAISQINSGTSASSSTFLRGDNTWATPSASTPLTTKGDILGHSTVDARIPVGDQDGKVMCVDSTNANGVSYACTLIRVPGGGVNSATFLSGDPSGTAELSLKGSQTQFEIRNIAGGATLYFGGSQKFELYDDGTLQASKQLVAGTSTTARPALNLNFANDGIHFPGSNQVQTVTNGVVGNTTDSHSNFSIVGALATSIQYSTSASNLTINDYTSTFILEPASVTTSQTLTMPAAPINGQKLTIACGVVSGGVAVTTLTVAANSGQTLNGNPAGVCTQNTSFEWQYRTTNTTWYRLR